MGWPSRWVRWPDWWLPADRHGARDALLELLRRPEVERVENASAKRPGLVPSQRAAVHDPAVVHGMCEDYRAGLRVDRVHEEADRAAGRQIACPTLLLAATEDDIDIHGDPETIWRPWVAAELRSAPIRSGHHQAEQAPDEVAQALLEFLPRPVKR